MDSYLGYLFITETSLSQTVNIRLATKTQINPSSVLCVLQASTTYTPKEPGNGFALIIETGHYVYKII